MIMIAMYIYQKV